MTQNEFKELLEQINASYESQKRALYKRYAEEQNPYKIGDIISDHLKTIKIEKIKTYTLLGSLPQCVYEGVQLNKDGSVSKIQRATVIYQENIEK